MNLNEQCLLNFLKNPNDLNELSVLLGKYFANNVEVIAQNVNIKVENA